MNIQIGKIRLQILLALIVLGIISVMAIQAGSEEFIAIVTGCTGGIIALGMKLLEGEYDVGIACIRGYFR